MKLTAENVNAIIRDCLFQEDEDHNIFVKGEAIMTTFAFHPGRLESHKADIRSMLDELPDSFHEAKGGGMSFLNACMTKDDVQWGGHSNIDELLALGIASGLVVYRMPRELWSVLPGGMPYFMIVTAKAAAPKTP